MSNHTVSRDKFIKGAAVGTGVVALGFPAFVPKRGDAAEIIRIGNSEEITGVYSALAQSQTRGMQMAVDIWNKKGGVLSRKIELVTEDNQNNPGVAVEKARKLINEDKVLGLVGTVNSADTLSTANVAGAMNIPFIDCGGHTDAMVERQCHWNTFMTCHQTKMITRATGYTFAKNLGKRWYMVTPDYTFGHTIAAGYQDVARKAGASVLGNVLAPLGTTDFSPYITKIMAAKPDVIIVNVAGSDFVNFMKQASQFGAFKTSNVGGWSAQLETIWALPPEVRVGYWGIEWHYKSDAVLGSGNTTGRQFAEGYQKIFGSPATASSCFGYVAMDRMLWAINQAKTTDGVKICRALEGTKFHSLWEGQAYYSDASHGLMWPMWVGKLRPNGTPEDSKDVIEIVDMQPAEKIAPDASSVKGVCDLNWPS